VAKKTVKRSATKKAAPSKAAPRPAAKAAKTAKAATKPAAKAPAAAPPKRAAAPASAPPKRAAATARPAFAAAGPSLGEHAERLRDEIQQSKLSHPDPWRYAAKARGWGERAQVLVELITVRGDTAAARGSLEALAAELQGDRDFQEARRLF
jgi:hypothetical protein